MIIRELAARLSLNLAEDSFHKGDAAIQGIKTPLQRLADLIVDVGKYFVGLATETVHYASSIHDTAQSIGIGTSALQELQFAASISGVSAEELSLSVGLLSRKMNEAATKGGEAGEAFTKLGVKVKDANGKLRPTEDVIGDLAEGFKKLPDGASKTARATELFGRSGKRLIPLLNEGRAGVAALRQEAEDLGIVLNEDTINAGDELGDTFDRLNAIAAGLKRQLGAALFPVLTRVGKSIVEWVKVNRELIKQQLAVVLTAIGKAAEYLYHALEATIAIARGFAGGAEIMARALWGVLQNIDDVLKKAPRMRLALIAAVAGVAAIWLIATAPLTAAVVAFVGIAAAIDDINRYLTNQRSLLGEYIGKIEEWLKPVASDPWWLAAAKKLVELFVEATGIADKWREQTKRPPKSPGQRSAALGQSIAGSQNFGFGNVPITPNVSVGAGGIGGSGGLDITGDNWLTRLASKALGVDVTHPIDDTTFAGAPTLPAGAGVRIAPAQLAPVFHIVAAPGQSPEDIGRVVDQHLANWWDTVTEETHAATAGGDK